MSNPIAAVPSIGGGPLPVPDRDAVRPRVLHVMGGAGLGGMERQLLALLPHLAVTTDARLVLIRGGVLRDRFAQIVPVQTVPKWGKVDPVCLARLARKVRRQGPDIVHAWGSTANLWGPLAARLGRAPHLVLSDVSIDAWKGRLLRAADRRTYPWADVVTGNSAAVVGASVGRGAAPERTSVIPNGVAVPRRVAGPDEREPGLVLYLGRLHPDKGPDILVEAVRAIADRVPDLRVVVAGPANQPVELALADRLRSSVAAAGLGERIQLVGPVPDPAPLLARAALLVLPSRTEGSPNAVLEAMAQGTPVVATAVGGVPDLLDGGRLGRLVPPEDATALGAAIAETLADPQGAAARAAAARRVAADRYSLTAVAARWLDLYRNLLG